MLFRGSFRRKKQFAEVRELRATKKIDLLQFIISPISIRSDMNLSKTVVDSLILKVEVEVVERVRNDGFLVTFKRPKTFF